MSRALSHEVKPWHEDVAKITLSWFPSRDESRAAEKEIIARDAPLHNRHHNITRFAKKAGGAYEPISERQNDMRQVAVLSKSREVGP